MNQLLQELKSEAFVDRFFCIATIEGLKNALERSDEVLAVKEAIKSGSISDQELRLFIETILDDFKKDDKKFPHETIFAAVAVAIRDSKTPFINEFLVTLAKNNLGNATMARLVAKSCIEEIQEEIDKEILLKLDSKGAERISKALYAGSFDPPTLGHQYIIEESAKIFDYIVIGIADNPNKTYLFTKEQRKKMLEDVIKKCNLDKRATVSILPNKFTIDNAEDLGATVIVRGLRNGNDLQEENAFKQFNTKFASKYIPTVLISCPPELSIVSSSFVKSLIPFEDWQNKVRHFVPHATYLNLLSIYDKPVLSMEIIEQFPHIAEFISSRVFDRVDKVRLCTHLVVVYGNRAYHNLTHIENCLEVLNEFKYAEPSAINNKSYDILKLVLLFHDSIYVPCATDNELQSSLSLLEVHQELKFNMTEDSIWMARRLITDSDDDRGFLSDIFHDVDYSVLGQEGYSTYSEGIRDEFMTVLDRTAYLTGRRDFLNKLLEKDSIYRNQWFKDKFENIARSNILAEIQGENE